MIRTGRKANMRNSLRLLLFFSAFAPAFPEAAVPLGNAPSSVVAPRVAVETAAYAVVSGPASSAEVSPVLKPVLSFLLPAVMPAAAAPTPAELGLFSPAEGPVVLTEAGRKLLDDAVFSSWMAVGGLGAAALSFTVAHNVDKTVGGIMSLISVGFWTAANAGTAVTHRRIVSEAKSLDQNVRRPGAAGIASLAGGILGAGALAALGFIFTDASGAAEIASYACFGLSAVAGGYGVYKSFEYASAAGADLSFF